MNTELIYAVTGYGTGLALMVWVFVDLFRIHLKRNMEN